MSFNVEIGLSAIFCGNIGQGLVKLADDEYNDRISSYTSIASFVTHRLSKIII